MTLNQAPSRTGGLTTELAKIVARLGRGLRYRTRAAREALEVTQAEADLLRLLDRHPGIRVQDAAVNLGVASNSVSTLVKQLTRTGLIQRVSDPLDGRAAHLWLTPLSVDWLTRVENAREAAIERALVSLDNEDQAAIEAALPALARLAKVIAHRESAPQ